MDATYIKNHIRDEVEGAKGYLSLYKETNDIKALHMSVDELGHAKYFVEKLPELPEDIRIAYEEAKRMIYDEIKKKSEEQNNEDGEQVQNESQKTN